MDLEALRNILGIEGRQKEALVEFAAGMAEEYIKNYCRVSSLPKGLETTALNMAADFYKAENLGSCDAFVKKLEEGDVAVTFESGKRGFKETFKGYNEVLDVFRKAGW